MKKTLLKINNMKRFCKWLDQTGVHLEIIRTLTTHPWVMSWKERSGIEKRLKQTRDRDYFCFKRAKSRLRWRSVYTRFHHYEKAQELLIYVKKRYARKKNQKI
jgi:hypothetical protein|tara:strand:- start:1378 stop:1686 length:309 start_codon:yes stop_codon:yes gene_type:complete